jgi:hypothetical protein
MSTLSRLIGLGYLALCLLVIGAKALIPLGPIGYAPLAIPLGPGEQPIDLVIWYGTEKEAWLQDAAQRFEASGARVNGRPIRIDLRGIGSGEIADRVARQDWGNDGRPAVISPASSLWVEVLRDDWRTRNNSEIIAGSPAPLVLTPLVAVAWEQRISVLWPNGVDDFWPDLHAALTNDRGWLGVAESNGFGADSEQYRNAETWGFVKFGHTSPLTSNSGAQALMLMAYGYHDKTSNLSGRDILDTDFQEWLIGMEQAVLEFGDSTGRFMTSMVQFGPSKYDLVLVYENLAIENVQDAENRWGQPIRVYYPPATIFSDHPFAILDSPLTTADQRAAAEQFQEYLLTTEIQALALQYGFRPANPNVSVVTNDPNNPFNRYRDYGISVDIAQQVQTPPGDVIVTLLDLWRRQVNR